MLTSYGNAFANFLGIPRGCNLSSYTKLYVAFLISGCFHALGSLHLPRPFDVTAWECAQGYLLFFAWQAAAITLEDCVIWITRARLVRPQSVRARFIFATLGYSWVFLSMWASIPWVEESVRKLGIGTGRFSPFPLTRRMVEAW